MSLCCDLDLENSKLILLHVLRLMKLHHNTNIDYKMFGSLKDTIRKNTGILILHCDLDLECSYPIFSQCIITT